MDAKGRSADADVEGRPKALAAMLLLLVTGRTPTPMEDLVWAPEAGRRAEAAATDAGASAAVGAAGLTPDVTSAEAAGLGSAILSEPAGRTKDTGRCRAGLVAIPTGAGAVLLPCAAGTGPRGTRRLRPDTPLSLSIVDEALGS